MKRQASSQTAGQSDLPATFPLKVIIQGARENRGGGVADRRQSVADLPDF